MSNGCHSNVYIQYMLVNTLKVLKHIVASKYIHMPNLIYAYIPGKHKRIELFFHSRTHITHINENNIACKIIINHSMMNYILSECVSGWDYV